MMSSRTRKTVLLSVSAALAMIFSYVESLIPFYFGVPGMKLGLSNICIVVIMFTIGEIPALFVNILRIVLTALLFTNIFSLVFSLAGAFLSFLVMIAIKRIFRLSVMSVSLFGGIAHNAGQLIAAAIIVKEYAVLFYLPVLLLSGAATGFLIGLLARMLIPRLKTFIINSGG